MSAEATHSVIFERGSPRPLAEIGAVLARHLRVPRTDAMQRVRYGGGFLASGETREGAESLARDLRATGVRVRRVEDDANEPIVPEYSVFALAFRPKALGVRLVSDRRLEFEAEEVRAFDLRIQAAEGHGGREATGSHRAVGAAGRLEAFALRGGAGGLSRLSPRARGLLERLEESGLRSAEFHFTLACREPAALLRIAHDRFDYSSLGDQLREHSLDNFLTLLEECLDRFPSAWNRECVESFLARLDPSALLRHRREETIGIERWILRWIRIDSAEGGRGEAGP